jgi:SAM-dependent methyltransferase
MSENHFAPIAAQYARFRPRYPDELFTFLASVAPGRVLAWDCATGSGQAAQSLARHFERVVATDQSEELLGQASPQPNVTYRRADALASGLDAASVDLVTVANAMHWFHGPDFEREVRRVLRPRGVISAWSYALPRITPAIDRVMRRTHDQIVGEFWIEPNRIVENGYRDLLFPFDALVAPPFVMAARYDLAQLEGLMRTWSASRKYEQKHGVDPVQLVGGELRAAWGDPSRHRDVTWTINLRIGRV